MEEESIHGGAWGDEGSVRLGAERDFHDVPPPTMDAVTNVGGGKPPSPPPPPRLHYVRLSLTPSL